MRNLLSILAITTILLSCNAQTMQEAPYIAANKSIPIKPSTEITFKAADGEIVYADYFAANKSENMPLIIVFHQAGSNGRGEYQYITPKLVANGYAVLQVDQRSGGGHFGSLNRTVNARGGKTAYCQAYPDMEAALAYAKSQNTGKAIFA